MSKLNFEVVDDAVIKYTPMSELTVTSIAMVVVQGWR